MKTLLFLRDLGIVFGLSFVAGLLCGVGFGFYNGLHRDAELTSIPEGAYYKLTLAACNVVACAIGFFIVGRLHREQRKRHLWFVAIALWLGSLINVAFGGSTVAQWTGSAVITVFCMWVGGWASSLGRREGPVQGVRTGRITGEQSND